uniref:Sarcoglycan delta n=1 Tax=Naja naja TaxID=35670 RepID=A0A8C6XFM3_NAJNA
MPQEQYAQRSTMQSSEGPHVYKVGIYGWRKRCLYFFVLLLMILILVNLAMTIWILKVMNFTIDGMGNLRITEKGLKLEGDSEFLKPLYAKEIRSRTGNPLYFQSAQNVTVNILNEKSKVLTRLVTGPKAVEAYSQKFQVLTTSGKLLFSADDNEVVVGAERLKVLGAEGTVFPKSIETPNVRLEGVLVSSILRSGRCFSLLGKGIRPVNTELHPVAPTLSQPDVSNILYVAPVPWHIWR